jgi:hypothetical protein
MSAAHWRKAMNFTNPSRSWSGGRATVPPPRPVAGATAPSMAGVLALDRR